MTFKGRVFKYGANVDTDAIIPARYLNMHDPQELAAHCMEDIDENFVKNVKKGDIIVAGANFGCGSSREHAPLAIKAAGISCVIAKSFARIFFRNAINIGLPALVCDTDEIDDGDELEVDLESGFVLNISKDIKIPMEKMPDIMKAILKEGGLVPYLKKYGDFAAG